MKFPFRMAFSYSLIFTSFVSFASILEAAPPSESPFAPANSGWNGQIRTRTEFDQKSVKDAAANKAYFNTQLRSRLGFAAAPSEKIAVKLEMQDSRYMGSEPSTPATNPAGASVGNSKGLDLLQGYATITEGAHSLALGRQKLSLGSGRFISTLEWSPTSRAFDGVSVNHNFASANLTGLVYLVRDSAEKAVTDRLLLSGLFYTHKINADHQADIYTFYDQSRLQSTYSGLTTKNYDLVYFGERVAGKFGMFSYEEEFIWQTGELNNGRDLSSAAFQLATRVGVAMGSKKVNAGLDIMSGDDDMTDNKSTTYRANYYFAHQYYGWMDYFVVNPSYGVMDIRLDGEFGFLPGATGAARIIVKPQYHYFLPQSAPSTSDDPYGQEFNLQVHLGFYPKTDLVLGAGLFLADDGAVALSAAGIGANQDYKPGYFLYCMPTFNF